MSVLRNVCVFFFFKSVYKRSHWNVCAHPIRSCHGRGAMVVHGVHTYVMGFTYLCIKNTVD